MNSCRGVLGRKQQIQRNAKTRPQHVGPAWGQRRVSLLGCRQQVSGSLHPWCHLLSGFTAGPAVALRSKKPERRTWYQEVPGFCSGQARKGAGEWVHLLLGQEVRSRGDLWHEGRLGWRHGNTSGPTRVPIDSPPMVLLVWSLQEHSGRFQFWHSAQISPSPGS